MFVPYIKKNHIRINLSIRENLHTLKEAYKLGLANKAEGITSSFIIFCTGIFLTEQAVGLYNASNKIYLILLTVVQGVSYTFMPVLLRYAKKPEVSSVRKISLIFYVYVIIGILLSVFTFIFADTIISIMFGEKFADSVIILKYFSITILLWPAVMFCSLIILAYNRYNYILITSVTSMILSVIFSLILINLYGVNGTGLVLPFVAVGTLIVSILFLRKISHDEHFRTMDLFSVRLAFTELSNLINRK